MNDMKWVADQMDARLVELEATTTVLDKLEVGLRCGEHLYQAGASSRESAHDAVDERVAVWRYRLQGAFGHVGNSEV